MSSGDGVRDTGLGFRICGGGKKGSLRCASP